MNVKQLCFSNIDNLTDVDITYLLYKEGKSIKQISKIRRMNEKQVHDDIIKAKLIYTKESKQSLLVKMMSTVKKERIKMLRQISESQMTVLKNEIYNNYTKYKADEDRMILIWLIGELKDTKFLPFLRMELRSKRVNHRRLACSALGKISDEATKSWLEEALKDNNPQVKQYAMKALNNLADSKTYEMINDIYNNLSEREYVRNTAKEILENIK